LILPNFNPKTMQWYYSKNGTQLGPVEQGELLSKIATGEVTASDLVWREGMADWIPSSQVSELSVIPTGGLGSAGPVTGPQGSVSPYAPPMASPQIAPYQGNIPTYLWQSIVVTLMCCWPFGIPAIVFAAKVDGMKSRGDIAGAMAASQSAKKWCLIAFWSGLVVILGYVILVVGLGASGNLN
jgi:hypothetical protein